MVNWRQLHDATPDVAIQSYIPLAAALTVLLFFLFPLTKEREYTKTSETK